MSKHIRPGIEKTLLLERYVWWQLKAGLAFHFGRSIKRIITYVRPLSSNNPGRRARQALPHPDPKADRFTHQLQHRTESEGSYHSLQSGNATALTRCPAVGINSALDQRLKDRLPNHQRPS